MLSCQSRHILEKKAKQATAVVAARTKIVQGAVSMVEMVLNQLSQRNLVDLDEEAPGSYGQKSACGVV
jgi:hypothetical protein